MAKISKSLLQTLLVSSASAEIFEVFSCNDETLDVSKEKLRYQKVVGVRTIVDGAIKVDDLGLK